MQRSTVLLLLLASCFSPTGWLGTTEATSETTGGPDDPSSGPGTGLPEPTTGSTTGTTTEPGSSGTSDPPDSSSGTDPLETSSGSSGDQGSSTEPAAAVCGDGEVSPGEECEVPTPGCVMCLFSEKYIFVSSEMLVGQAIGSLEEADSFCQSLAKDKPLIGDRTFVAWLSDEDTSAISRVGLSTVPYKLPDGLTTIAKSTQDLIDGALQSAIIKDENAVIVLATTEVWTGTLASGIPAVGKTCASWTGGQVGQIGQTVAADATWTADSAFSCSQPARVYCIEKGI